MVGQPQTPLQSSVLPSQLVFLEGVFWKKQVGWGAASREPHRSLCCWEPSSLLRF